MIKITLGFVILAMAIAIPPLVVVAIPLAIWQLCRSMRAARALAHRRGPNLDEWDPEDRRR